MTLASPIRRRRDGTYTVRLDPSIRTILASVAEQMIPLVESDDVTTKRLFPPAYVGDDHSVEEREYRSLVDGALRNHHRGALSLLVETAGAQVLSADQLTGWLSAIGSMRLVLGTRLDVREDMATPAPDHPSAGEFTLYGLLGALAETIISALAVELPDEGAPERIL
jgi:Domain of unknown function (DUF2017)